MQLWRELINQPPSCTCHSAWIRHSFSLAYREWDSAVETGEAYRAWVKWNETPKHDSRCGRMQSSAERGNTAHDLMHFSWIVTCIKDGIVFILCPLSFINHKTPVRVEVFQLLWTFKKQFVVNDGEKFQRLLLTHMINIIFLATGLDNRSGDVGLFCSVVCLLKKERHISS